jgi:hypothetical protein
MSKFRRKTYIVDKKVQLTLTFTVIFAVLLSSFALCTGMYCVYFTSFVDSIGILKAAEYGVTIDSFIKSFPFPITMQILFLVLLSIGFGIYSIFYTHRIVGPLVRLKRGMTELKETGHTEKIVIRKGDYLTEVVNIFNDMAAALEKRLKKDT